VRDAIYLRLAVGAAKKGKIDTSRAPAGPDDVPEALCVQNVTAAELDCWHVGKW